MSKYFGFEITGSDQTSEAGAITYGPLYMVSCNDEMS
jgi:hypothetical protein